MRGIKWLDRELPAYGNLRVITFTATTQRATTFEGCGHRNRAGARNNIWSHFCFALATGRRIDFCLGDRWRRRAANRSEVLASYLRALRMVWIDPNAALRSD